MRLLSYNIHKGVGNDRRYRLERIVQVIKDESPDVICLQEVDCNVRRSRYDDQPRLLADALRAEAYTYQLNVPRKEGGYGNLILSRWPFRSRHRFHQATSPLKQFRSFPSFLMMMALDKLFYRGRVGVKEAKVVRSRLARRASDHLPLVADLQLFPHRKPTHHLHPAVAFRGANQSTLD